jgi:Ca2+-binding RTX toxin-like protein
LYITLSSNLCLPGGFVKNRRQSNVVARAAQTWSLEQLEPRRLMSAGAIVQDGILILTGTASDDQFYINKELGGVCVQQFTQVQGESYKYTQLTFDILNPMYGLRGLRVDGGDGNDSIRVSEDPASDQDRFDLPVTLIGGQGDDSLQGGSGDDVLIGGPGDNLLDGRGGNNVLDGPTSPLASARYDRSSKTLYVTGTRKDDVIELIDNRWESYDPYHIYVNGGGVWDPDLNGLKRVIIEGLGGNDIIHVDAGDVPVTIYGGAGDDSIFGGTRSDVLIGGSGHDMIFADMTKTHFPVYWEYNPAQDGYDPEQFVERTDGINRFNDGAGNDVLIGEGPDEYVPPAPPTPTPSPTPSPTPNDQDMQAAQQTAPVEASPAQDSVAAPPPVQFDATPFAVNALLVSDKELWDA